MGNVDSIDAKAAKYLVIILMLRKSSMQNYLLRGDKITFYFWTDT